MKTLVRGRVVIADEEVVQAIRGVLDDPSKYRMVGRDGHLDSGFDGCQECPGLLFDAANAPLCQSVGGGFSRMSQFWYSDERWCRRSRCCCSLGVVVVVFGGDLLRWILGGFVLVNPLPCAACPGDGFLNEGVESSFSVAPIGEVHEAHVSNESCNTSNDVTVVPLARHTAGQEDFVGIQP